MPGTRLAIDHDHKHCPGKKGCPVCIRGALCNACNNGLRVFHDDVTLLYRAIDYLQVKRLM